MSDEQINPRDRTHRLSLFLAGVMGVAESIALRHPGKDGSENVTRDRLMTSRIPGMIVELEALIENTVAAEPAATDLQFGETRHFVFDASVIRRAIADLFTFGHRPHACMTGDCPHQAWAECVDAIRAEILQVDVASLPAIEAREAYRDRFLWLEANARVLPSVDDPQSRVGYDHDERAFWFREWGPMPFTERGYPVVASRSYRSTSFPDLASAVDAAIIACPFPGDTRGGISG